MDTDFEFVGTLSLQETLEMDKYRLRVMFRPLYRWLLNMIALFLLIMGIYRLVTFEFSFFPVAIVLGAIYGMVGWKIERQYRIKKRFKKDEHEDRETIIRLNKETVYIKNELMETSFDWNVIKRVIKGPAGILVQVTNYQNLFFLPSHYYETNKKQDRLMKLFQTKDIPIKILS